VTSTRTETNETHPWHPPGATSPSVREPFPEAESFRTLGLFIMKFHAIYATWAQGSIPGGGKRIFLLASVSRPALKPIRPRVQWVPGSFPRG
jgi:hypothetical protein